jgi:inhibitor of growth protein 3
MAEDAASVLEQFVQDGEYCPSPNPPFRWLRNIVANLPAEIQHLFEEIQAKDRMVQECRNVIATRDNSIQKFLKNNGAGQANPKEQNYCNIAMSNFEKAQTIQEEKISLSDKAALLLDRQIKRLDFKIRDLQNEGSIQPDPQLPSLLNNNSLSTRLPPLSTSTTGASTPLHPLSGNAGPSTTIANSAIARLAGQPASGRQPSPLTTALPSSSAASSHLNPARAGVTNRSPSTDPQKRRRLNPHHLTIPATSSGLRQSSLGPGTPKGGDISRQSSAGPTRTTHKSKPRGTGPPHQRIGHLNPTKKGANRRRGGGHHKKSGTPASTGDEDSVMNDGEEEDVEMEGDEEQDEGDDKKYCVCHSVSYGNMVACDNDDCPNEWFHWNCVGVKAEPAGKWYCPDCREGKNGVRR